ncbi:flocculation protein FLO11-like [Protopterus annectens]|uniref:flocculation protein FLO11-like n=1 Tax=Protopterus annectens TaxID=7888 RepID=UPI001CFA1195|nr:flocculation protein FLO11-like [Protopterus annectens]
MLRPIVNKNEVILTDTKQFLTELFECTEALFVPSETILMVTLDVNSLFTCIPNDLGKEMLREYLTQEGTYTASKVELLCLLMEQVLVNNTMIFNHNIYSQREGVDMGTSSANSYANIVMANWEKKNVVDGKWQQIRFYKRFIDDLFLLWFQLSKSRRYENKNYYSVCGKSNYTWVQEALNYYEEREKTKKQPALVQQNNPMKQVGKQAEDKEHKSTSPSPDVNKKTLQNSETSESDLLAGTITMKTPEDTIINKENAKTTKQSTPPQQINSTTQKLVRNPSEDKEHKSTTPSPDANKQTHQNSEAPDSDFLTRTITMKTPEETIINKEDATEPASGMVNVTFPSTDLHLSFRTLLQTNTESGLRANSSSAVASTPNLTSKKCGAEECVTPSTVSSAQHTQHRREEPPGFIPPPSLVNREPTEFTSSLHTSTPAIIFNNSNKDTHEYQSPHIKTTSAVVTTKAENNNSHSMLHPGMDRTDARRNSPADVVKSTSNAITLSSQPVFATHSNSNTVSVKALTDNIIRSPLVNTNKYSDLALIIIIPLCIVTGSAVLCLLLRRKQASIKKNRCLDYMSYNVDTSEVIEMMLE